MSITNKKILILTPGHKARGGITGYYETLHKYFSLPVEYFVRGSRNWPNRDGSFSVLCQLIKDLFHFYKKLRNKEYALVQTTTSFSKYSLLRDALYIIVSKSFKLKVIVFFHGGDSTYADYIEKTYLNLFRSVYFKADSFIDLSNSNVERFKRWNYIKPIYLETTVVDDELIKSIDEEYIRNKYKKIKSKINILYLARVEIPKGIYEALDTYIILKNKNQKFTFTIAGDGHELENVKAYIISKNIKDVNVDGFVQGEQKLKAYKEAHLYILPSYFEGMPTTVIEAMAFGLPIITRSVGGIPDFFKNGINGYMTDSKDPQVFAHYIELITNDNKLLNKIAINNYYHAHNQFLSKIVVKRIESIFNGILKN